MTFLIQSFQGEVRRCCLFHRQSLRSLLMRTLWLVESDTTACRLLKKIHCPKSTGRVYILKYIFPVLSQHRGCVSFSHISHAIIHAKHKLQDIADKRLPLKEFKQNFEAENRLATLDPYTNGISVLATRKASTSIRLFNEGLYWSAFKQCPPSP